MEGSRACVAGHQSRCGPSHQTDATSSLNGCTFPIEAGLHATLPLDLEYRVKMRV